MTPSSPALRVVSIAAAAAVLAMAVSFFPGRPAAADSAATAPAATPGAQAPADDCGLVCLPILDGRPEPADPEQPRQTTTGTPAPPPAAEAPAGPQAPGASPAAAVPGTVPSTPDPADGAAPDGAPAEATAPGTSPAPPKSSAAGPDWNTPVTRSARATQAAAITAGSGAGTGGPELLPIAAGTLLVGAGGGAFIWWGRNRLRTH